MKTKTPSFSSVDKVQPDKVAPNRTPADARTTDAERRMRAGYRQTIFTSATGAALTAPEKKTAMGA